MKMQGRISKDVLKTAGAILLIGVIVVATFLYGNAQRQEQARRDQVAKQQQEQRETADKPAEQPQPAAPQQPAANQPAQPGTGAVGGGSLPETTPKTGGELAYLLPAVAVVGMYRFNRTSRQRLRRAACQSR
ncbi:hypothetical protein KY386_03520 [Candidatus Parcubacteria bacterium]|nr:hypothetical protein [Candidatus Parcubacteria bacterium]